MKTTALLLTTFLGINFAQAETVICTGRTNDPNTTAMNFEIEIKGNLDKVTGHTFYKSVVTYTLPDGSSLKQGIDLNEKPRVKLDKIIYSGSLTSNYLELSFGDNNTLQTAILNHSLASMKQLPVQCEIGGVLPQRPICSIDINKNIPLLEAIKGTGDLDQIETAIACGANVNKSDENGCTPIMIAVESTCGQSESIPYHSPFAKTVQIVEALIENGAFVAVADKNGETPLIKAAKFNLKDIYTSFIATEADFDAQDNLGNTALMYAAINGDAWVVRQILEGNPDRRLKNKDGKTAFDIAKQWERSDVIDLVRIPDASVIIEGQQDGSCSPLQINLKQGQVVEFALNATSKMFKLDAKALGLDLMADGNSQAKQIITLENKGTYSFTCGYHGANQVYHGKIVVQ